MTKIESQYSVSISDNSDKVIYLYDITTDKIIPEL